MFVKRQSGYRTMQSQQTSGKQGGGAGEYWGGFAAMLVALPSSIAFGITIYSPLGPAYVAQGALAGILGAVALGLVVPLSGGAARLISAPCAPAAAVMGAVTAELIKTANLQPVQVSVFLLLVGILSALLQVIYGSAGGGKLIKYIPYPVVSGYLSGVGMLIFISQAPKFLGFGKDFAFWDAVWSPELWNWQSIFVGSLTIVGMVLAPRFTKAVPGTIIGLGAGLLGFFGLALADASLMKLADNPLVIGPLFAQKVSISAAFSERWQALGGVDLASLKMLLMPALTLSVLLSIDTLKTCVVLDALTRSRHDSNRVLVSQGIGNLVAALAGGMPGAGTMGATLVNVNSGGTTRYSSWLEGIFVLAAFLLLGNFMGWVPIAALAGILIVVACRMFDWSTFHLLKQKSTFLDFGVIAAVIVVAVAGNLIAASATGIGLSVLLFIREQIRGSVIRRKFYGGQITSKQYRQTEELEMLKENGSKITACELQGSLFFGTTDKLFTELEPHLKLSRYVIMDMRRVQSVDYTATHMLDMVEDRLAEREGCLLFSGLPACLPSGQDLQAYFGQMGLLKASQHAKIFDTLDDALEWAEDRILEEVRGLSKQPDSLLGLEQIPLLREIESPELINALKACVEERQFKTGDTIFKRGELGDEVFLIRCGIVRILLPLEGGRHYVLTSFAQGSFFGEIAFLDRGERTADAVATCDTALFCLSRKRFDELVHRNPVVGIKVFARLARGLALRLRHADAELRALKET
jgi:SulP family sulfate permease